MREEDVLCESVSQVNLRGVAELILEILVGVGEELPRGFLPVF